MNRIDRLTAILIHLQSKRVVKAQELADRFGLSLRTVYRDIRALEEAGVPIGAEAGIGYFLTNYQLPPVMFTNAEASALLVGGKLVASMADQSLHTSFDSALYKIKAVLSRHEKDHLDELANQVEVLRQVRPVPYSDQLLMVIQSALVRQHCLRIDYVSGGHEPTQRVVEPIGLLQYGVGWHLIAYCQLRQDYRDFRVDRIRQLTELSDTFRHQNRLSLQAYLQRLRTNRQLIEVVVIFSARAARFAERDRYDHGFVSETVTDAGTQMTFLTEYTLGLSRWLLLFGNAVQLVSPDSVREQIRTFMGELTAHYGA